MHKLKRFFAHLLILSLFGFSCFSLFYFTYSRNDIKDYGSYTDVIHYIDIYNEKDLDSIPKHYRYRIFTPYLAKLIPLPSSALQSFFYVGNPEKIIHFRLMLLNTIFIAASCYFLFLLLLYWEFSFLESVLGGYFFLCSHFVLTWAFMANADAASYFFLIIGLLFIHQKNYFFFGISLITGLFFKETTALIILFALMYSQTNKERIYFLAASIPGTIAYFIFRYLFNKDFGDLYSIDRMMEGLNQLTSPGLYYLYMIVTIILSLGILWFFAAIGFKEIWKQKLHPFLKLSYLLPAILLSPFLIKAQTIGRIWFLAFPIFIPAALIGLRKITPYFKLESKVDP